MLYTNYSVGANKGAQVAEIISDLTKGFSGVPVALGDILKKEVKNLYGKYGPLCPETLRMCDGEYLLPRQEEEALAVRRQLMWEFFLRLSERVSMVEAIARREAELGQDCSLTAKWECAVVRASQMVEGWIKKDGDVLEDIAQLGREGFFNLHGDLTRNNDDERDLYNLLVAVIKGKVVSHLLTATPEDWKWLDERFGQLLEETSTGIFNPSFSFPVYGPPPDRLQHIAHKSKKGHVFCESAQDVADAIVGMPLAGLFRPEVRRTVATRTLPENCSPRERFVIALEASMLASWGSVETFDRLSGRTKKDLHAAVNGLVATARGEYSQEAELVPVTLPLRGDAGYGEGGYPVDRIVGEVTFAVDSEFAAEFAAVAETANAVGQIAKIPGKFDPRNLEYGCWCHHPASGGDTWEKYICSMTDEVRRIIRRAAIGVISGKLYPGKPKSRR